MNEVRSYEFTTNQNLNDIDLKYTNTMTQEQKDEVDAFNTKMYKLDGHWICLDPTCADTEPIEPSGSSVLSDSSPQDDDGIADGIEDKNQNGKKEYEDTDPNKLDMTIGQL